MAEIHILIILFFVSVESATVIPPQTDILLLALFSAKKYSVILLLASAVAGSIIGGFVNYFIGRYIRVFENKKWFPIKQKYLKQTENLFQKHGRVALLLVGMPVVGDAVAVTAGMLHINPALFAISAAISRAARYTFLWFFSLLSL